MSVSHPYSTLVVLCLVFLGTGTAEMWAQRESNIWYFGNNAGITFESGAPVALSDGALTTFEGNATISDPLTGELLFYTNGETVWNATHEIMENGTALNGDLSTSQSALILPWPNRADYYIIVNPAPISSVDPGQKCFCLMYSVVDMSGDNGRGSVVLKNQMMSPDVTEHVTATRNCDDTGWWIVARRRNGSSFISFEFTEEGINPVAVESRASNVQEVRDVGQMHISPDGQRLVITASSGVCQLYHFRRETGSVVFGFDLFADGRSGNTYGASFSADSKVLYIASTVQRPRNGINVYRFDVSDIDTETLNSFQNMGFLPDATSFAAMQLGPDGNIYVGRPNLPFLAAVVNPELPSATLVDSAVALTNLCFSGLPNIPGWFLRSSTAADRLCRVPLARLEPLTACEDDCLRLSDVSDGNASQWYWDIPGALPATSNRKLPVVCFPEAGTYNVTLRVGNVFGFDTTSTTITITPRPTVVTVDTVLSCAGQPTELAAVGADFYQWQPASLLNNANSSTPIATSATTTLFTVIGTNNNGCTDTASVLLRVVELKAGADITICEGGSGVLQASPADSYQWSPTTFLDDPTIRTPIANPPTTTTYKVTLTAGGCSVVDSLVVRVGESFDVNIETPANICEGERIELVATGGGSVFSWSGDGVEESDSASTYVTINGTTTVIVRAVSGNCVSIDTLEIVPSPEPTIDIGVNGIADICVGDSVELAVVSTSPDVVNVIWSPPDVLNVASGERVIARPTETTVFTATATTASGCTAAATQTVVVRNSPEFSAGADVNVCKGGAIRLLSFGSADAVRWEPTDGLDNPTSITPIASPSQTTTYTGIATRDGCELRDTVTVFVSELNLSVLANLSVCAGSAVELVASGAVNYKWSPETGLSDPNRQNPVAAPSQSTTYEVTGTDIFGCSQTRRVTVTVLDTTSIILQGGSVVANAGEENVSIPIFVDVDPARLPITIDGLFASFVHRADVFLPTAVERGTYSTSLRGTGNEERATRINLRNITIVTPRQKITEIIGTVLLGEVEQANFSWEEITWDGVQCPQTSDSPGRILITGCALSNRVFSMFTSATVQTFSRPGSQLVEVHVGGSEPGTYTVELLSTDGRVLSRSEFARTTHSANDSITHIDMSSMSNGIYHVVVRSPFSPHISRIVWMP